MEIRIVRKDPITGESVDPFLVIIHGAAELRWNIPPKDLNFDFDVFEQINGYWAQCAQATQDEIFETYAKIYDVFQRVWDISRRARELTPLVANLMEYHPQEDIYMWAWSRANILVPSTIHRTFDTNGGMAGTPERTYLEEDYRWLVTLSISLRVMFPIWRQFTTDSRTQSSGSGVNVFKEFQAFGLLSLSNVRNCKAMQRLALFVKHTIPRDRHNSSAILVGISSEDIPNWVLSVTVVTRLSCGDVRGINPNASEGGTITTLPAFLYNFILQKLRGIESMVGNVSPKYSGSYSADGDSNLSKIEGFKIKQPTATGNIEAISAYLDVQWARVHDFVQNGVPLSERSLAMRMNKDPAFPQLIVESMQTVSELETVRLTREQATIAAWALAPYVPVRSIPSLSKQDVLKIIAFAQAYLFSNQHFYLASIVGAEAVDIMVSATGGSMMADRKDAIEKEEQLQLIERFPFNRRTASRARNAKNTSPVMTTIETLTQGLSRYQWRMTLPDSWVSRIGWNPRNRIVKVPADIRTLLAQLILDVDAVVPATPPAEHNWPNMKSPATNWAETQI